MFATFTPLPKQTVFRSRYGISSCTPPEYLPTKHDVEDEMMLHVPQLKERTQDKQSPTTLAAMVVNYLVPRPRR